MKAKFVEKDWGYEIWLANNEKENYCGKILRIKEGFSSSMHFHMDKHETFYILRGQCKLTTIDTATTTNITVDLLEGNCYTIDRLVPHQVQAITDCDIIESSTFHRDEDSYRVWRD